MTVVWTVYSVERTDRGDVCRVHFMKGSRNPERSDFVVDARNCVWRIVGIEHTSCTYSDVRVEQSA